MATVQQVPGIARTGLQEHDLSIPGRMVIRNVGAEKASELATVAAVGS